MPKTYLTLKEREKAERERKVKKENFVLTSVMREAICRRIGYDYICAVANLSKPTVVKIVNHPDQAKLWQLRAVCEAADIPLEVIASSFKA
jgi:ATP-dependent protease Clp ATPase subunit